MALRDCFCCRTQLEFGGWGMGSHWRQEAHLAFSFFGQCFRSLPVHSAPCFVGWAGQEEEAQKVLLVGP